MRIAIASGKGGTGKTTIATNLARSIASIGKTVQYLDCDVEEPNGKIFLKPNITETKSITIDVPEVNSDLCNGCGKCGDICQYSAIISMKEIVMTFDQLCHSCGGCLLVCPTGAITEKPREIGYADIGTANGVEFVQGRLKIGDIHTPPLIKKTKAYAIEEGVVIIDAPPGTSCPVIEAVKDADFVLLVTEPTPFGLNDLKLAVSMVRELQIPFAVIVNRYGIGDEQVEKYCKSENIELALKLADDRRIAEAYSTGQMVIDVLGEYKEHFLDLYGYLKEKVKARIGEN